MGLLLVKYKIINRYAFFRIAVILAIAGIVFCNSAPQASAEGAVVPSFGMGRINVRLYTDYFCPPCRAMEPKIEPLLTEMVKKNYINLTFVDTPLYKPSILYARYFLYIMNEKKDFDVALHARSVLINAALEKIMEEAKLGEYLKEKGVKFKPFEVKTTFAFLNNYLKEDKINSTPTCVIDRDGKIERLTGESDIVKALENLKQAVTRKHN